MAEKDEVWSSLPNTIQPSTIQIHYQYYTNAEQKDEVSGRLDTCRIQYQYIIIRYRKNTIKIQIRYNANTTQVLAKYNTNTQDTIFTIHPQIQFKLKGH